MAEGLKEEEKVTRVKFERENLLKYGVESIMYATKNTGEKFFLDVQKGSNQHLIRINVKCFGS